MKDTQLATPSLAISWSYPTFLLALFALPSLLGVTNSLAAALGLAVTVAASVFATVFAAVLLRHWTAAEIGPAVWLLLTAIVIAALELLLQAFFYELWRTLGLFLPLSITGCLLFVRAEMRATYRKLGSTVWVAARASGGFALAAGVLGAAREFVGRGSLLHDAGRLLGSWASHIELIFFRADMGFLLAALPPGAFLALGIGVAFYNWAWLLYKRLR